MNDVKTRYISPKEFRKAMTSKKERWIIFDQLARNLSVRFPEENRGDLVAEATIQCIAKFKKWDKSRDPFRYFTSVCWNCMRSGMGVVTQWQKRHAPLLLDNDACND